MTTLIIGGGLVGSQIARILVERGDRPVIFDRAAQPRALGEIVDLGKVTLMEGDVMRPLMLSEAIRTHGISNLIHLAANANLTIGAQRDPYAAIELNIMGTVNVLEAARVHGLKRVVVASSSVLNHHVLAGDGTNDTMREEGLPRPISIYSSCKQAVESLGLNYARWYGVDFAAVRYGAVCGPWRGDGGGGPSKVFLALIQNALRGEESIIPSGAIEWVYSKDAASGTVAALDAKLDKNRVFNLSMGRLVSAEDIASALKDEVPGARPRIEEMSRSGPAMASMTRASSMSLAREVLGFTPHYQIRESIHDMVRWAKSAKSGN